MTQDLLNSLFDYRDGCLYWKNCPRSDLNGTRAGSPSGSTGRRQVRVKCKLQLEHRVIFLMIHGYLPAFIDHIDGDYLNNRIENLRPVTRKQNAANRKKRKNCSSSFKGVSKIVGGRFQAYIGTEHLGFYDTELEAALIYDHHARDLYGEFARLNFP